jgi:hypothetical protein
VTIVVDKKSPKARVQDDHDLTGTAGRFVAWAGVVYLVAIVVDVSILWLGQRQEGLNFEFVALNRTAEAFPRFILATALIYAGLALTRTISLPLYRAMAGWVLVLGTMALIVVTLTILNYLSMASTVTPEAKAIFRSAVVKTGGLGALYVLFLIPLGIVGFRTRRR